MSIDTDVFFTKKDLAEYKVSISVNLPLNAKEFSIPLFFISFIITLKASFQLVASKTFFILT